MFSPPLSSPPCFSLGSRTDCCTGKRLSRGMWSCLLTRVEGCPIHYYCRQYGCQSGSAERRCTVTQMQLPRLGVARGPLQERPLQFRHGNVRVKSWQPMSNSWSTSGQPDFVRALARRKTVRNHPSKILYTELLKSSPTLGQLLANSPPHGKLQGSSLQ